MTILISAELLERVEAEARRRGCSVSRLVCEALEQYLAS
jgi:predicted DNA binding CopG/RHH family protein